MTSCGVILLLTNESHALRVDNQEDARAVRPYSMAVSQLRSSHKMHDLHPVPSGHRVLALVSPVTRA